MLLRFELNTSMSCYAAMDGQCCSSAPMGMIFPYVPGRLYMEHTMICQGREGCISEETQGPSVTALNVIAGLTLVVILVTLE